ncbi:hypothetical protein ER57_14290 [Smithella sp. SCADC]|jgi:ferredoxin|nr:hypothetical protein ER57_14290 [Smithella sp. SCADC]
MTKDNKVVLRNKKGDLKKLVMLMNKQNKRFWPPFFPLLNMLDLVLTPEELNLLLRMRTDLYSYEQAFAVSAMGKENFNAIFESLRAKGFIGTKHETDQEQYTLHPFIVGWLEAIVPYMIGKPEEKEFARRYMSFFKAIQKNNFFPARNIMNIMTKFASVSNQSVGSVPESKDAKGKSKIIIDEKIVAPDSRIYPTSTINDIIMEYGSKSIIGQFKACMCRKVTENVGDPCRFKMKDDVACMIFGDPAKQYIKYGHARQISKEEAFDIIQKARDLGAVHSVFHEKDDTKLPQVALCNCCWDCCGQFRLYNMGALPLRYSCFYVAKIAEVSKCNGCGLCEKFCPTAAIKVVEKKVELDTRKCIGCGQCVHQCVRSVTELVESKRTVFLPMLKKSEIRITT